MKTFHKILFAILFISSTSTFAQEKYTVKGVVKDSTEAVAFANVVLYNTNGELVTGITTDLDGTFTISAEEGKYELLVSFIGYTEWKKEIRLEQSIDLETIVLQKDANVLDELAIQGREKLFERKVDRLVFNVENSISASGGDVIDLLKSTPGVQVQSDGIGLIGKSGVKVYIDDREMHLSGDNLMSYLQSISADDIESIEVITTPPARYEAEGNSGVINIRYKKKHKNAWSNNMRTTYRHSGFGALNVGNTFNYDKNKLSFSVSGDVNKGSEESMVDTEIDYPDELWMSENIIKHDKDYYNFRGDVNYDLSDNANIGALVLWNQSRPDNDDENLFSIYNNESLIRTMENKGFVTEKDNVFSANVNYRQILDSTGTNFIINLDYFNYTESKSNNFHSKTLDNDGNLLSELIADNNGDVNIDNFSAKIDFELPTDFANFGFGAKSTFTKTKSDNAFYDITSGTPVLDENQSDIFTYEENIHALYAEASKNLGSKWQFKLGLRYEFTKAQGKTASSDEEVKFDYHKLFPTAHTLYLIDESNFLSFSYSRRINRPSYWYLNPFRWYLNENSYVEGNPFLQPSFNDNIDLTYGHKQKWFTSLFLQFQTKGYSQIPMVDSDTHVQIMSYKNAFKTLAYGLSESYTFTSISWLESNLQLSLYRSKTSVYPEYKDSLIVHDGFAASLYIGNNIQFNEKKTILGELNYSYTTPTKQGVYKSEGFGGLNVGMKFLLLDKDLELALNVEDILDSNKMNVTAHNNNVRQKFHIYNHSPRFRVSLRYKFGNKKIGTLKQEFGNEEERNRL